MPFTPLAHRATYTRSTASNKQIVHYRCIQSLLSISTQPKIQRRVHALLRMTTNINCCQRENLHGFHKSCIDVTYPYVADRIHLLNFIANLIGLFQHLHSSIHIHFPCFAGLPSSFCSTTSLLNELLNNKKNRLDQNYLASCLPVMRAVRPNLHLFHLRFCKFW